MTHFSALHFYVMSTTAKWAQQHVFKMRTGILVNWRDSLLVSKTDLGTTAVRNTDNLYPMNIKTPPHPPVFQL